MTSKIEEIHHARLVACGYASSKATEIIEEAKKKSKKGMADVRIDMSLGKTLER